MNLSKAVILFFAFCLFAYYSSYSQQWTQTRGPGGGSVVNMIERNGAIVAATLGGVFRSTDNGENWYRSVTGIPEGSFVTIFAQTAEYLYAAGYSEGLFRSIDNGVSWTAVPIDVDNVFILDLFCVGEDIYIGCEGAGVVRSIDAGVTFHLVNNGFSASANVVAFAQVGQYLFSGLAGNGGTVGVYRSPLGAINWTQLYVGGVGDIAVKGTDLFITAASGSGAGVFRSTDLGITWAEPLPGFNDFGGLLSVYQGDLYTAKDGVGIFKSTNDGTSWAPANTGLKPLSAFSYLSGTTGFFVGFERGIARTSNNAASWDLKSKGLTNTSITSLMVDGNRLYATSRTINAGSSDGVFFTDDGGQNWTPLDKGLLPSPQGKCITKSGNNLILGTTNYGLFIKKPTDTAFVKPLPGVPVFARVNALISSGQYVLAGVSGDSEMYRSNDYGLTWVQSNTGFNPDQEDQVYSLYEQNGVIYAGAFNALYKTTDHGLTWANSSTGIYPGAEITGITGIGNDLYAVDNHNLGIYKSTNNGASWFNINNGIPVIIQFNAITASGGILYAGSNLGVYRSIDSGASWTEFNDGLLSQRNVLSFSVYNNELILGTDETAVWKEVQVLPLQLISFTANPINNNSIKLSWTVEQENVIQNYIIERAVPGTDNFIPIGNILPSGSSLKHDYAFIDKDAKRNTLYQYRLRIADGLLYKFSEIRTAIIKGEAGMFSISPNPVSGEYVKILMNGYTGDAVFILINFLGQPVYQSSFKSNTAGVADLHIGLQAKGIYILRIETETGCYTKKVLIK